MSGTADVVQQYRPDELKRFTTAALNEVELERERQRGLDTAGDTEAFDRDNTRNDWIAFVSAYTGRAAARCWRNERENLSFRANMVKAAALCLAAIEAHDKGYC